MPIRCLEPIRFLWYFGFEEGKIIGRVEVCLSMVRYTINHKITNNYEEALKLFKISEEDCARMMDYLPVRRDEWIIPSDSEWEKRRDFLREKLKGTVLRE